MAATALSKANSGRSSPPQASVLMARKLSKLVDSGLESDPLTREALEELSTFFGGNTLKNRRQLRGRIERRSLQINADFLEGFREVKEALDLVCDEARAMNEACAEMQAQLRATRGCAQDLVVRTTSLQKQERDLRQKAALARTFRDRYQLRPDEEAAVVGRGADGGRQVVPVSREFFAALDKVHAIRGRCQAILAAGTQQHQLLTVVEIIDQMSQLQDVGLDRLHRWTLAGLRNASSIEAAVTGEQHPENVAPGGRNPGGVASLLPLALKHLALMRPLMFKHSIDEYCTVRRSLFVRAFLDALTVGGPHGTPRPIELYAHDPLRYVGDMLAWLHQATPTEVDNLRTLLAQVKEVREIVGVDDQTGQEHVVVQDRNQIVNSAVCNITEGVCRPLRSRVEQILVSENTPLTMYKLANLVKFYSRTVEGVTSAQAALAANLREMDELAYKRFLSLLQSTVTHHTALGNAQMAAASSDLAPSQSSMYLLSLLREVLSSTSVLEEQKDLLDEIVGSIVDPLLKHVNEVAGLYPTSDQDVFVLNSLYQVYVTLSLFKFVDARLQNLEASMQLHSDTLCSEQTSNLIANLEIQPICTMISQARSRGNAAKVLQPLAKVEGMGPEDLKQFLVKFDRFLAAPDTYLLPQIRLLSSAKHRRTVVRRSLQVVSVTYKQLYEAVVDPSSGYTNPTATLVMKTPEQVDMLLQL